MRRLITVVLVCLLPLAGGCETLATGFVYGCLIVVNGVLESSLEDDDDDYDRHDRRDRREHRSSSSVAEKSRDMDRTERTSLRERRSDK